MSDEEKTSSTLNILLLGEVGVGKSTLVNSFANYIRYSTLRESEESKMIVSIPTTFTIVDEEYEEHELRLEVDDFSDIEGPREYEFEVKGFPHPVRLIDTPGVGGLRARELDESNICRIKDYMLRFEHIHAICFVLKPNLSVLTEHFKFCFKHLLSCIDQSAAKNVIFAFSHTRSTFYHPGETMSVLQGLLKELREHPPNMDVPLSKSNVFCFDNEGFRYRAILREGFPIDEREKELFAKSWHVSAGECRRLLDHVASCRPYKVGSIIQEEKSANFRPNKVSSTIREENSINCRPYKVDSNIREEKPANFRPNKVSSTIREENSINCRPYKVDCTIREEKSANFRPNKVGSAIREEKSANCRPYKVDSTIPEKKSDSRPCNVLVDRREEQSAIAGRNSVATNESIQESNEDLQQATVRNTPSQKKWQGKAGGSKSKKNKNKQKKDKKKKKKGLPKPKFMKKKSTLSDEENVTRQKACLPKCSIL